MTKKDFIALAAILAEIGDHASNVENELDLPSQEIDFVHRRASRKIADYCATKNPMFNRTLFLNACGVL